MAASRKDLLKAHNFTTQRLVSALVNRNPDDTQPPLRRVGTATFVSILLGVVLLAGSALFGLIRKQVTADQWQKGGVVILDSGSGSLFIWDEPTRRLVPMNDITSARLAAGGEAGAPEQVTVKSADLKGIPQGQRQGIPGAPYQLPLKNNIKPFPLRVCATEPNYGGERFLTVQIGDKAPTTSTSVDLAVQTPDNTQYLIINGTYHKLITESVISPLIEKLPLVHVSPGWLAALPQGHPIQRLAVPGKDARAAHGEWTIGTLFRMGAEGGPDTLYFIQLQNGIARIAYLDMRLLIADGQASDPTVLTEAQRQQYMIDETFGTPGLPLTKPQGPGNVGDPDKRSLCATYPGGDQLFPNITVGAPTPMPPPHEISPNKAIVEMDPLTGALLQNTNLKGDHTSSFLVTNGRIYGIPDMASRKALGYDEKTPLGRVPAGVLALFPDGLPQGVQLSRSAIRQGT